MASNLGSTPIQIQYLRGRAPGTTRAIWYARYIEWFITTPLLLLLLLLATGLNVASIVPILFMDLVWVVSLLLGALTHSAFKWGYYAFAVAALFFICACLFLQGIGAAGFLGSAARGNFIRGAIYVSFLWALYPVCWALSEGGNVISPTSEMVFYGILDILTKPIFIALVLFSLRKVDYDSLGFSSLKASASAHGTNITPSMSEARAGAPTSAAGTQIPASRAAATAPPGAHAA
jgi:bacteriorhodopsin